jgi:DNA-binding NtrC family response regulator
MQRVILLVDDEPYILQLLTRALRNDSYTIYTARTADESVNILKGHKVDLIVSDDRMPGLSGMEFLAWVTKWFPDVPRIMLTGHPSEQTEMRAMEECRVYRFFTKPCDVEELAKAIRTALESKDEYEQSR